MLVKTIGPADSTIFILGDFPDEYDGKLGRPFENKQGAGGILDMLLSQVGINKRDVRLRYVSMMYQESGNMSNYFYDKNCTIPKPDMVEWIELLRNELEESRPNVVIAMGSYALWALTGIKKISEVRGYVVESTLVPGVKVIPTYSPLTINAEWKLFSVSVFDIKKAFFHSTFSKMPLDKAKWIAPASYDMFMDYLRKIRNEKKRIAFDIEAHIGTAYPYLLGIADSAFFGMSFYIMKGTESTMSVRQEADLWILLAEIADTCEVIMHNVSYDKAVMWLHHGILFKKVWMDTLIAAHVIWPEYPRDLGFLGSILLDVPVWKNTSKVDTAVYNALDAIRTFAIAEPMFDKINTQGFIKTHTFETSMIDVAMMMQLQGIKCDNDKRLELIKENKENEVAIKEELDNNFGKKINFNSSKQVQQLLYYDLGLEPQFKRRKSIKETKVMTVDAKALKRLSRMYPDHTWLTRILDYKKTLKLNSFLEAEPSPEGRYHTSYNVTGSAKEEEGRKSFGRWSSSESIILTYGSGNLQNIPPVARKMYRADDGKIIVTGDLKQAEAVIVSYMTGDVRLQSFFRNAIGVSKEEQAKYDVHKLTASVMFGVNYNDVTPELRKIGKTLRHACSYSAGPDVVADQLGCGLKDAKILLDLYHRTNPLLKVWYQTIQNSLKSTRSLTTPLGRKHVFLGRWNDSTYRSAYSYLPQSTIGDHLNESMRILYDTYGDELDILLQLHDAIYVQCEDNKEAVDLTMQRMRDCMVRPIKIGFEEVIVDVDFHVGYYWGDMFEEEDFDYFAEGE